MNRIDLRGRAAVVTGGGSGLGRAVTERLLASGARVTVWDRSDVLLDEVGEALAHPGLVSTTRVDVTDFEQVCEAAAQAESALGRIDVLVTSAGITCSPTPIEEYRVEDWLAVLEVNLSGVFFCCRAVIPGMISRGYGRVINVASMAGKEGNPQETAYAAAKAGVIALTKSLGKEVAAAGVLVNAVAPGVLTTPMRTSTASAELVGRLMERTPIGRPGDVDEVAALVAWMASAECSYTSGFTFDASGGRATY